MVRKKRTNGWKRRRGSEGRKERVRGTDGLKDVGREGEGEERREGGGREGGRRRRVRGE